MSSGGSAVAGGGARLAGRFVDREPFVRAIVDEFERNRMGVAEPVVTYILTEAIVGDRRWIAGIKQRRIDLELVKRVLTDAFDEAGRAATAAGDLTLTLPLVEEVFPQVIEQRWRCPFPFLLC